MKLNEEFDSCPDYRLRIQDGNDVYYTSPYRYNSLEEAKKELEILITTIYEPKIAYIAHDPDKYHRTFYHLGGKNLSGVSIWKETTWPRRGCGFEIFWQWLFGKKSK